MSAPELVMVRRAATAARKAAERADTTREALHAAIRDAVAAGVSSAEVADVAGVSRARVSQLAPVPSTCETRIHAQKKGDAPVCVTDADTVPVLPATPAGTLSGRVSQRQTRPYGRPTMFWDTRWERGTDVGVILAAALEAGAARVMLVGPAPLDPSTGATQPEQVRAWAFSPVDPSWTAGAHYLNRAELPVLKYEHTSGHKVTIQRGAGWWGETDADAATCEAAWVGLGKVIDGCKAFRGAGLGESPSVTGRALWLRTIPEGKGYPVLCDELRELITATSGQGRRELLPPPPLPAGLSRNPRTVTTGGDFTYMDGRFMYAGLTWGMPVGEPVRWTAGEVDALSAVDYERAMRGRGRWRITATVPAGWDHVGLLMAPEAGGGWCYPSRPGQVFTTWADGAEVWLALTNGWSIVVHEGITWAEGKPLDVWTRELVGAWQTCQASEAPAARLAGKAIRSILLFALGAFQGTGHPITRSAPAGSDPDVPAGTPVRLVGENLVWQEQTRPGEWTENMAHPEWSATVWARARVRLLDGPGAAGGGRTGALHLPRSRVIAFSTDALYLAEGAPDWADDGKPGRFRSKGTAAGPFTWPATYPELYALRDRAASE